MSSSSLDAAKKQIQHAIDILRASTDPSDVSCADMLERKMRSMGDWYTSKEALFQIGEMCSPKALGDRFIPGMTIFEWGAELERLHQRCAEAFNEMERAGPATEL